MDMPMHKKMQTYVKTNNLSQRAIAANMKISESRLSSMLNGNRRITVEDFFDFCNAIAVDPKRFYESEAS